MVPIDVTWIVSYPMSVESNITSVFVIILEIFDIKAVLFDGEMVKINSNSDLADMSDNHIL